MFFLWNPTSLKNDPVTDLNVLSADHNIKPSAGTNENFWYRRYANKQWTTTAEKGYKWTTNKQVSSQSHACPHIRSGFRIGPGKYIWLPQGPAAWDNVLSRLIVSLWLSALGNAEHDGPTAPLSISLTPLLKQPWMSLGLFLLFQTHWNMTDETLVQE